ncbi:MAG TPA: glycosyltransferase [Solirubrobacterales bacterium]|nr:glycosyltransferase [Solirubrobacterales bacterium]
MQVLVFHGYLLRGTGSNVYNASVARALAGLGHDVHLLCQDLEAASLPWVDAVGRWPDGELVIEETSGSSPGAGSITAYLPDIGGLLPLYVADEYAGFEARPFPDLSAAEVESYVAANVAAVRDVVARAGGVDAALANHLVMGPVILARAADALGPFAAKVHGSALSYTVIPHRRFLPYAREGMAAARAVLVGSHHTAESLWRTVGLDGLREKTRLGPPGVDVEAFAPLPEGADPADGLKALASAVASAEPGELGRDPTAAATAIRSYAAASGPRVTFVGKLIVSKGCDLLLAAWPLIAAGHPGARLLMVGFGEYREGLVQLAGALGRGDLDAAREIARLGRALEGGEKAPLELLGAFLADPPAGYLEAARASAGTIDWAGRLEYGEVAAAVRSSDAMVVPSTFPEAFGMVAAEAAATGALPVCADHSGLAEVAGMLAAALPAPLRDLTAFPLAGEPVGAIADRVDRWLALPADARREAGAALTATVRAHWSWEGVARTVVAASAGELDALTPVPEPG